MFEMRKFAIAYLDNVTIVQPIADQLELEIRDSAFAVLIIPRLRCLFFAGVPEKYEVRR
jgi:hypothetical protein